MAATPTENFERKRPEQQQPSEIAKTYAPKIEVARLAIRATAQTSLFPESIHTSSSSTSPYHLRPLDRRIHHSQHHPRHVHYPYHYAASFSESPPKYHHHANNSGGDMPSVPSSNTTATSTSAGKRVTFGVTQTFNYPNGLDTPPDSDEQVQDDSADDDEDDNCFNTGYDEEEDNEAPPDRSTSASTPPSTVEPPALRLDPKIDPRTVILTTHRTKGYRFIQDEVLNQISKRRQYKATITTTNQWQPLPPSPSPSFSSPPSSTPSSPPSAATTAPTTATSSSGSSSSASSLRSVETQLNEFIEKAKAASLRKKQLQQKHASVSDPVLPRLAQANTEFGASLLSELDRITGCHGREEGDADADDDCGNDASGSDPADKKHIRAASAAAALLPSPRYTELRTPKVIYASVADPPEKSSDGVTTASLPVRESIWRCFPSQSTATLPLSDATVAETKRPGRLYIRVLAAENLDFPIDQEDTTQVIRCVLSTGTEDYVSEYMPMGHTVTFGHDFHFDVEPDAEFKVTLHIGNSCSQSEPKEQLLQQQQQQLSKLFGKKKKKHRRYSMPRGDSILRYVNRTDGAIAQARVSMESIIPECRGRMCTASFPLVNGWYRFARSGFIPNKHKQAPERAVGKLTAKLLFLEESSSIVSPLPGTFAECEEGINILKDSRHCWKTGYMSQLGGDLKYWRRRFYSLKGWRLFSYPDSALLKTPRAVLDLSRATCVVADNRIVSSATNDDYGLIQQQQLLQIPAHSSYNSRLRPSSMSSVLSATNASEEDLASCSVKNSFRIIFETGESVDFFCDSTNEREEWLAALGMVIGRVPNWPEWIPKDDEENNSFLATKTNRINGDDDMIVIHIPPAGLPALVINQ